MYTIDKVLDNLPRSRLKSRIPIWDNIYHNQSIWKKMEHRMVQIFRTSVNNIFIHTSARNDNAYTQKNTELPE